MVALVLAMFGASPVAAQEPPSRENRIAAQIDRYLQAPRSAATYRALAGMGDPDFLVDRADWYSSWDSPMLQALDMKGYTQCRWSYSDQVYKARVARFGEQHPYVRQWLDVQRAVFSRCDGWEKKAGKPIPPPLRTGDDRIARLQAEDRAYQLAAADFYEGQRAKARTGFAAIAARPGDHQAAARLMVTSIDAGSEPDGYSAAKASPITIARAQKLVRDPAAKAMQANAHELVGWIGATADTREARQAQVKVTLEALALPLETIRTDEQAAARYRRSADDLPALFTDFDDDGWWVTGAVPKGYYGSLAMAEAAKTNSLAAFALTQRPGRDEQAGVDAQQWAWKQYSADRPDRDAWRVALLQLRAWPDQSGSSWPEIDALLARVAAQPTDHDVALLGFLFDYQVRQGFDGAHVYDEAKGRQARAVAMTRLAAYPYKESEHFRRLYSHALNSFIKFQDIASARRLRDLVEPQLDDGFGYSWLVDNDLLLLLAEDETAMVKIIAERGAGESTLLNRLPARRLARLSEEPRLDAKVRTRFARVAWTRDYVLGRKTDKRLDASLRALNPQIASGWKSRPGAKASDRQLLLDVLGTPGMNLRIESRVAPVYGLAEEVQSPLDIDYYEHSKNNWWCAPDPIEQAGREEDELEASVDRIPRGTLEALLARSHLWQSLDRQEREALAAVPNGAKYLTEKAIAWGKKASKRRPKGADEALALAVRATRYGCQFNGGHGAYSKAAWELLHDKFPGSDAARRTRWWFDCKHFTYGCSDSSDDDYGADPGAVAEETGDAAPYLRRLRQYSSAASASSGLAK
ncbi:MAG TPA: hypothetical protein VEB39_06735 [Sphingomicrobium sp.]|nr:hypothetical protein [Sphingomicrobium sp.]